MAEVEELTASFSTSSWSEWEGINVDNNDDKEHLEDPFESQSPQNQLLNENEAEMSPPNSWVAFDEKDSQEKSESVDVESVFKTCFELPIESNEDTLTTERTGPLTVETKFLHSLHKSTVSLTLSSWSHSIIKDHLFLLLLSCGENLSEDSVSNSISNNTLLELNNDDDDDLCVSFDWSHSSPNREGEGEEEEGEGVTYSPDLMQGLLRPVNGLDSPVEFEFDRDKATLGLSMLSCEELILMRDEMASKVTKQSDELVTLLQCRDTIIRETDAKNKFIAALLRVQDHKQSSMKNSSSANNLATLSYNGFDRGGNGTGSVTGNGSKTGSEDKEVERRPSRSRSRSLTHNISQNLTRGLSLAWSRSKSSRMSADERNSEAYLHIVIPYTPLQGTESYSVPLLKQWIKILKAMADRNPHLPHLISTYLQSEVLTETTDTT